MFSLHFFLPLLRGPGCATGCKDGKLRLWDVATSELLSTMEAHDEPWAVQKSDGSWWFNQRKYGDHMGIIWGSYGNITDISDKWIHQWHQMMSELAIQCEFMGIGPITNADGDVFFLATQPLVVVSPLCFSHAVLFWGTSKNTTMSVELNGPVEWNVRVPCRVVAAHGAIWGLPEVLRRRPCGRWKLDHCRAWSDGEALGWEE